MPTDVNTVDVIIAAWNAQATIGRAIQSALDQPEVKEVIVVDDASTDETEAVVRAAAAVYPRVVLISSDRNKGPAAARNLALTHCRSDYITVLDADDFLLPGRFAQIFRIKGWDAIADNIAFVPEAQAEAFDCTKLTPFAPDTRPLDLGAFVAGNIPRPGRPRAELGLLKPVIRRFIDKHRFRYRERLRLWEGYASYVEMLVAGGAFMILRSCGYVLNERASSLSGQHRTRDLAALPDYDARTERLKLKCSAERSAVREHRLQLETKLLHRELRDLKRAKGRLAAIPALTSAVLSDKFYRVPAHEREVRYLR